MAILGNVTKKVKDVFKVLAGSAVVVGLADILKNIAKEKGAEFGIGFIKSLATGEGLENEAIYGYILDRCKLKTEERKLLVRAIQELRIGTDKEKEAANNFIVLVALGEMDKSGKLPGEYTINGFIHRISEYPNEVERIQMVKDNVVHIGTNAKTKQKIEIAKKWALKAWEQVKGFTNEINALSAEYKNDAERELKEFKERPLWKKLFLN